MLTCALIVEYSLIEATQPHSTLSIVMQPIAKAGSEHVRHAFMQMQMHAAFIQLVMYSFIHSFIHLVIGPFIYY